MTTSATATSFYLDGAGIDVIVETPEADRVTVSNLADQEFTQTDAEGNTTTLTLKRPTAVNRILLGERIEQGQHVKAFRLEAEVGGEWIELKDELLPEGEALTPIGYKRIICFPTINSRRFRLTVTDSKDVPLLREFSLYLAPPIVEPIEGKGQS